MAEKSKTLNQFEPSDFKKIVYMETANVGEDFLRVKQHVSKSLSVSMTI